MKLSDNWFTALSENETQQLIYVTGRTDLEAFRTGGKFPYRAEIRWSYQPDSKGMPQEKEESNLIIQAEDLLRTTMEKDKLAILTGIYTGGGEKYWVFYLRNIKVFGERLNDALAPLPPLPLQIECEEDKNWEEYTDMLEMEDWSIRD